MKFMITRVKPVNIVLLIALLFLNWRTVNGKNYHHKHLVDSVRNANNSLYKQVIGYYDSAINEWNDLYIHIEKCKFIENVFLDSTEGTNPKSEDFNNCLKDLLVLSSNHKKVLLYKLKHIWGDTVIELSLKLLDQSKKIRAHSTSNKEYAEFVLNSREKAEIYSKLSYAYSTKGDSKLAVKYGLKAIKAHDTTTLIPHLANQYINLNKNKRATNLIYQKIDVHSDPWDIKQAADILVELKEYSGAAKFYNTIISDTNMYFDYQLLGTAYENSGQVQKARTFYLKDLEESYSKQYCYFNLLKYDLKYSNTDTAYATYKKYRDEGLSSDPLAFLRFKLLLKKPFLQLRMKDIYPILFVPLIILALFILPYLWVLPIYFYGLKFDKSASTYENRFGLKQFWFVSSGYLIISFLAYSVFNYQDFINSFFDSVPSPIYNNAATANTAIFFVILMSITTFSLLNKADFTKLFSRKDPNKIFFGYIIACFLLLTAANRINFLVFPGVNEQIIQELTGSTIYVELKAIYFEYGLIFAIILLGLLVPIYEEFVFRGIILESLEKYFGFKWANVFQSTAFAIVHFELKLLPYYIIFGILTGFLKTKTNRLGAPIILHALVNLTAIISFSSLLSEI